MANLLAKIPDIVQMIALVGMAVSILATLVARIIPGTKDDEAVGKFVSVVQKLIGWMPTLGVNPQTKKLEEAYQELKAKVEAPEVLPPKPEEPKSG